MNALKYFEKAADFSTHFAFGCFSFGTLIFAVYALTPFKEPAIITGIFFILAAIILNSLVFLNLIYFYLTIKEFRQYFAVKILIVLANIPVAALYFYLVLTAFH